MFLEVSKLTKNFGGLSAVDDFDMYLDKGQIVGLLGPNGAGKTTIFNLITGFIRPKAGKVVFDGIDITGKSPHKIAALGMGRTFQLTPLFANFTTLENVVASFYLHSKTSFWNTLFNMHTYKQKEAYALESSNKILEQVGLSRVKDEYAKNLPHGFQKMLGIARALAIKPKLLMLDEPLSGMNTEEINFTMDIIRKMQKEGLTIFIIEHNMQILDLCNKVIAINFGKKICDGSVAEVRSNPDVIKAYLGEQNVA